MLTGTAPRILNTILMKEFKHVRRGCFNRCTCCHLRIALLVSGQRKLPELGREIGDGPSEGFKSAMK